ncbi:fimbrial protein [Providencia vermicola]|uniref:fimbrial protein n=1 Tax=Providencia vermicola TaxID=333965 RepID=UPI001CEC597C|nr:type 1 fimbrial protein [Providencia vermicola]
MEKIKQALLTFLIMSVSFLSMADDGNSVRYNFSVLFLSKTCEIDVPSEIIFGNQSGITTASDIKSDNVTKQFPIGLKNCSTSDQNTAIVYIASGNTLAGRNNIFNDNPNDIIGVQLLDNNRVVSVNESGSMKPSPASILWDNIQSTSDIKIINAKLRCAEADCEPNDGDFSAKLTIGYYAD